jgi:putative ABC transport system substrate-binding protein
MISRRRFVSGIGAGLLAPVAAEAQQAGRVYRIGFLSGTTVPDLIEALRQGLRERGWIEGQNLALEDRSAESKFEQVPQLAGELVRRNVDVIVVTATAIAYLRQTTANIPVVFVIADDP